MKPAAFEFVAPKTLDEALILLDDGLPGAKVLAGGQSLLPILNFRLAEPSILVDLNRISELRGIALAADGGMRIGATTRTREIELSPEVRAHQPLLACAVPHIAHVPIRNRGTIGGSLCHADPASELPAVALALGAEFEIVARRSARRQTAAEFFKGVYATDLAPGEVLAAVHLPPWPDGRRFGFAELSRRRGDFAIVGCIFWADLNAEGRVEASRLVFFGVADRPVLLTAACEALAGGVLGDPRCVEAAVEAVTAALDPDDDLHASGAYRRDMAAALLRKVVAQAQLPQAQETAHG